MLYCATFRCAPAVAILLSPLAPYPPRWVACATGYLPPTEPSEGTHGAATPAAYTDTRGAVPKFTLKREYATEQSNLFRPNSSAKNSRRRFAGRVVGLAGGGASLPPTRSTG